jgi:hypothetical protein
MAPRKSAQSVKRGQAIALEDYRNGTLSGRKCAEILCIPSTTFQHRENRVGIGEVLTVDSAVKNRSKEVGNKFLTAIDFTSLKDMCGKVSRSGKGYSKIQFKSKLYAARLRTLRSRKKSITPESTRCAYKTFKYYWAQSCGARAIKAYKQTAKRYAALNDLKNHISNAAVLEAALRGENGGLFPEDPTGIRPELACNNDSITLFVENDSDLDCIIRMRPEDLLKLKRENRAAALVNGGQNFFDFFDEAEDDPKSANFQRRAIKLDFLTAADGNTLCVVATVKDYTFDVLSVKTLRGFAYSIQYYLIRVPKRKGITIDFSRMLYRKCFIPTVIARREKLIGQLQTTCYDSDTDVEGDGNYGLTEQFSFQSSSVQERIERYRHFRILLTADGALCELKAAFDMYADEEFRRKWLVGIDGLKWGASLSLSEQPNDKGPSHRGIKLEQKKVVGESKDAVLSPAAHPEYTSELDKAFETVKPASRRTFVKFLTILPALVSTTFTIRNVSKGFQAAGMSPFDWWTIISQFAGAALLTDDDKSALQNHHSYFVTCASRDGFLDHSVISNTCGNLIEDVEKNCVTPDALKVMNEVAFAKPMLDRDISTWSTTLYTNSNVLAIRQANLRAKANMSFYTHVGKQALSIILPYVHELATAESDPDVHVGNPRLAAGLSLGLMNKAFAKQLQAIENAFKQRVRQKNKAKAAIEKARVLEEKKQEREEKQRVRAENAVEAANTKNRSAKTNSKRKAASGSDQSEVVFRKSQRSRTASSSSAFCYDTDSSDDDVATLPNTTACINCQEEMENDSKEWEGCSSCDRWWVCGSTTCREMLAMHERSCGANFLASLGI